MSQYCPKPYKPFGGDINVKVYLSVYATKIDLKNVSHVDVRSFALKSNLANLKSEVDKLDIGKLQTVSLDLAKLSNKVANDVITKSQYISKVHSIDTTDFVKKTKYEQDVSDFEDKINKVDKKYLMLVV